MSKKLRAALLAGLLVLVMICSAACGGKEFDASGYVKSFMDMLTKGELEDYMEYTGRSEEEAKEDYSAMTDALTKAVGSAGGSEELQEEFRDLFVKVLAKSKYTVHEAEEVGENSYKVDVEIEPITGLYDGVVEEVEKYAADAASSGETDQNALVEGALKKMTEKMEENLDSISYGDPKTVTVEIEKNSDGNFVIKDEKEVGQQIGLSLIDTSALE